MSQANWTIKYQSNIGSRAYSDQHAKTLPEAIEKARAMVNVDIAEHIFDYLIISEHWAEFYRYSRAHELQDSFEP